VRKAKHQEYARISRLDQTEKTLGRRLPFSTEAERAVLSSLLLNDEHLVAVVDQLATEDFYDNNLRQVYQGVVDIARSGKRLDIVTLQHELEKRGCLEAIGGIVFLLSLQEDIPSVGLVLQHVSIIKDKAILRELIGSAAQIITNCYSQDEKAIEAVLDDAEKTIFQISQRRASQDFVQIDIWLKKTFEHLSSIKTMSRGVTGTTTGYKKLDRMTSGLQKSDMVVLAARPSMGKTGLALSIARNAVKSGTPVGFFSLEMAAEQLTLRLLSIESGIPHHDIRTASVKSDDWVVLTNVAAQLSQMKLFIDDTPMQSITDIRAKARKLKMDHNIGMIVIDYLQLLSGSRRYESRHQEVSEISRSIKALAKELEIPILALSQLSRAVDGRVDKRPMLSDLRESGAIEQDADLIMFLYRDVVYNKDTENPFLTELIIGKQRNGATGVVNLHFEGPLIRFEDFDDEY
jgi:replicative DNA helicase